MSWGRTTFLMSEVLEYVPSAADRPIAYDLVGWSGGAVNRGWLKVDGALSTRGGGSEGEYQALFGRLISPFWDAQVGVRADVQTAEGSTISRVGAVLGLQGLAPGWFELEPSLFLPSDGNLALDLTASYDLYLTQRLVFQPRVESAFSLRDDARFGAARGLSAGTLGLRTRYEWRREFAPYAGVLWERAFGSNAARARANDETAGDVSFVFGVRMWR